MTVDDVDASNEGDELTNDARGRSRGVLRDASGTRFTFETISGKTVSRSEDDVAHALSNGFEFTTPDEGAY
jgi:hypothetical protein